MIFDEATSALDSKTEAEFMETVAQMQGAVTMIIIAHRLSTLRVCDELIQMREGRIVAQGSYERLIHAT
jgi:ABC-type bacteriocin/lantibiotic exporter with double-glycine peptidase domain